MLEGRLCVQYTESDAPLGFFLLRPLILPLPYRAPPGLGFRPPQKHIELSPEQVREIVDLKRMFLTKIEPIMEERKHLNVSIQTNLPHDTYHTKNSISYIKVRGAKRMRRGGYAGLWRGAVVLGILRKAGRDMLAGMGRAGRFGSPDHHGAVTARVGQHT